MSYIFENFLNQYFFLILAQTNFQNTLPYTYFYRIHKVYNYLCNFTNQKIYSEQQFPF